MSISPSKRSLKNAKSKGGKGVENCPVKIGKEYEVDITETTPDGVGIARIKGVLILVGNAKRGDHLKIRITAIGSISSAEAEIVN